MEWILYCSMLYIEGHKWTLIIQWWKRDTKNSHSQCFASKLPKNIPWRAVVFHGLAHCVFCNQATEQSIQSASSWQQHVHVHRTLTGYVFSHVLCGWRSFLILPSGDILFSITLTQNYYCNVDESYNRLDKIICAKCANNVNTENINEPAVSDQ